MKHFEKKNASSDVSPITFKNVKNYDRKKTTLNKIISMVGVCLGNVHRALRRANVRREQGFQECAAHCVSDWV